MRRFALLIIALLPVLLASTVPQTHAQTTSLIVDTTSNDAALFACDPLTPGDCSLRGALSIASGFQTIEFDIPGGGPHVINAGAISVPVSVIIDGTTEPDFGQCPAIGSSADLAVVINGTITLLGNNVLKGVAVNGGAGNGVVTTFGIDGSEIFCNVIAGAAGNNVELRAGGLQIADTLRDNFIGVQPNGVTAVNGATNGVAVLQGTRHTITGNVIAGATRQTTSSGVMLQTSLNEVSGNLIGVGADGVTALSLERGISLSGSISVNEIFSNIIANGQTGIYHAATGESSTISDNCIQGNRVGLNNTSLISLLAVDNWWGATDGPAGQGTGSGNPIIGNPVLFTPFITSPPQGCSVVQADIADLSLTKSASDFIFVVGDTITYTITVTNSAESTATATNVQVTDQITFATAAYTFLGSNVSQGSYAGGVWNVGSLAPGASATLTVDIRADSGGFIENVAEVTASDQFDPDSTPGNYNGEVGVGEDDVDFAFVEVIDAAINKTVNVTEALPGDPITYTITASLGALGEFSMVDLTVQDVFPVELTNVNVTCSASGTASCGGGYNSSGINDNPTLGPNSSVTYTVTANVVGSTAPGTVVSNTAVLILDLFGGEVSLRLQDTVRFTVIDNATPTNTPVIPTNTPDTPTDPPPGDTPTDTPTATTTLTATVTATVPSGGGGDPSTDTPVPDDEETPTPTPTATATATATATLTLTPTFTPTPQPAPVEGNDEGCGFVAYETRNQPWRTSFRREARPANFVPTREDQREVLACPEPPTGTVCFPQTNDLLDLAEGEIVNTRLVDVTDTTQIYEAVGTITEGEICINFDTEAVGAQCAEGCALAPFQPRGAAAFIIPILLILAVIGGGLLLLILLLSRRDRETEEEDIDPDLVEY